MDHRNWQPATSVDEYLRNIRDGLEERSDRRFAQLMGWSRIHLHRVKLMSQLPEELFELLLAHGIRSTKGMAQVAEAMIRDDPLSSDIERCPHCGEVLRTRRHIPKNAWAAIREWLKPSEAAP